MTVSELRTLVDNLEEYIHVPGGIDRLKKMVLHLAVSGQLVPQNPSEGTGEELYREIQAEKAKLVEQGEIRKGKILPEISEDEIPFEIPRSWRWTRVSDLGYSLGQKVPDEDFYYVDVASIDNESQLLKQPTILTAKDAPSRARKMVKKGTVIYSTVRPYLLNTTIIESELDKELIASTAFAILHPFAGVDPWWLLRNFTSNYFTDYTNRKSVGMAYPAINDAQFSMAIMPLPPLAEQKRIVAKVDNIFVLIDQLSVTYKAEQTERSKFVASALAQLAKGEDGVGESLSLAHLSEIIRTKADAKILRQTILHLAVSGQLVPQDSSEGTGEELYRQIKSEYPAKKGLLEISEDDKPFNIPGNWKWVRLPEIYRSQSPVTKLKTADYLKSGKYPIVDQGQRYIAGYTNSGEPNKVSVPVIIFGDHTREIKLIDFDFIVGADGVKILEPIFVDSRFFFILIDVFRPQSRGYGRHFKMLNDKIVPLPPLGEQKRIATKAAQLTSLVDYLEQSLEV